MGFPLLLESALELGDGLLEAGPLLRQLVDTLGELLQLHGPLINLLAHILHVPGRRDRRTERTVTSSLVKIYQGKLIDRNVDHLTHAAQVVPWKVHHLERVVIFSSRSWHHSCFIRSTCTLQD
jgi:hypothetical protein